MGKKKDKMAGAATGGTKIPKQIAGVKLPKDLRRKGEALIAKATSPQGQAALAKGLTMAATLATAAVERSKARAKPEGATAEPAAGGAQAAPVDPKKAAEAI